MKFTTYCTLILSFTLVGCKNPLDSEYLDNNHTDPMLDVYMDYDNDGTPIEQDKRGFYHLTIVRNHPNTWYSRVHMKGSPYTRVYWSSPDSFSFVNMWREYTIPIIQNSTYISSDSVGTQLFLTHEGQIGDTLQIIGYIDNETYDFVQIVIH